MPRHINLESSIHFDEKLSEYGEGLPPTVELPVQNTFIQYPIDRFETGILRPRFETAPVHVSRCLPSLGLEQSHNYNLLQCLENLENLNFKESPEETLSPICDETTNIQCIRRPPAETTLTLDEKEKMMLLRHKQQDCKPCAFVHRPEGCQNGGGCDYCHLCPPGELKRRKTRKRRNNNK